jgi:SAM-dependent methyltransferase
VSSSPREDRLNTPAQVAEWLEIAAHEKAASIVGLTAGHEVKEVIEIGTGSGAVLGALDRAGFAERYWACEPTADLLAQMKPNGRLVEAVPETFDRAFPGKTFDLAILSHVVEHLLAPAPLINEALQRAKLVVVEVPIEGNAAGNARSWVKGRMGSPRVDNMAGHVQFFSRREARELIGHSGGTLLAERGYFPLAPYRASEEHAYQRFVLKAAKVEPLARLYYEHFAMLCTQTRIASWNHVYAPPR